MPVTLAPRAAMASDRMPPPQPTSSTRLPRRPRDLIDPAQAQRVDLVQRLEFAVRIPPAVGELAEFLELQRIDVDVMLMLG